MTFQAPWGQSEYRGRRRAKKKAKKKAARKKAARKKKAAKKKTRRKKTKKAAPRPRTPARKRPTRKKKAVRAVEEVRTRVGRRSRSGEAGVWIPPRVVEAAGLKYGDQIDVQYDTVANRVVITARPGGPRAVSRHRGRPIVDLVEKSLTKAMAGVDEVVVDFQLGQIVLTPTETRRKIKERLKRKDGLAGSAFTGGGYMDLAAELAGYVSRYGIEVERKYAEIFEANRGHGYPLTVIRRPLEQALSYNLHLLQTGQPELIPKVELLLMGIPCNPWSKLRGGQKPCEHRLYDMTQYALALIAVSNPLNVVIEEVPQYVDDPQFGILKAVLKREGYHVTHKVVESDQLGYATKRPRVYIVATTQRGFSWSKALKKRGGRKLRAKDILLPPSHPLITSARTSQGNWFSTRDRAGTGNTLRTLWERENWTPLFIDPNDAIPTIAKNYYKPAPTGPFVVHPTKPDTYRLLTVEEIRRAHEVPEGYLLPGAVGTQAESLGQGVIVPLVQAIVEALPGGAPSRTIDVPYQRVSNPAPVVPMYYGTGPLYSTLPWGWLA